MMKFTTLAAIAALLAGCAASGVKVSDDALAALKAGQTTVADAVAALGEPTSRMRAADGSVVLQYVYAEAKVRAASFVPVVGAFAGGTDTRARVVVLRFGPDGRLIDSTSTDSQYGTGVGASAGAVSPGQVQQPRQ
jgi:sulfur carrier protein ThiS